MDFSDRVNSHAKRVVELKGHCSSEEAAKSSLIMPFLQLLGYDAFDPRVVVPEFAADVGTKKGERVDYALKRDGDVIILIEAKAVGDPLDGGKAAQLHRYFHGLPSAKIAILTDGVVYKFFTDLDKPNIMDERPFMVFDFANVDEALIPELKKLCNDCFDVEEALSAALDLKYLSHFKKIIVSEITAPSDELVKLFAKRFYTRPVTASLLESFRAHVVTAFEHNINSIIAARLRGAISGNAAANAKQPDTATLETEVPEEVETAKTRDVETTVEEWEGYFIIKAILRKVVDVKRIAMRDTLSYCGILLDDNNRKPVCRLHFNSPTVKYLETFGPDKKGTRHRIEQLDDIFKYAEQLRETVQIYENI